MEDNDPETDSSTVCPHPDCDYTSSEQGVKIHYGRTHEGTISGTLVECHNPNCDAELRKHDYRFDRSERLFCSTKCHYEWKRETDDAIGGPQRKRVEVDCAWCDRTVEKRQCRVERAETHFCSPACRGDWDADTGVRRGENNGMFGRRGADHPRWKGGHDQEWRRKPKWRRTARAVYRRDGYTCQKCGAKNVEIHAHHKTPVCEGGAKYDLDNLVALCIDCHFGESLH